ncbi:metalloreductase transmembrane [Moniliophthora roreri MCA 2997]|nr:metalloreductase transmembrane [Moniliophthora roreri MCA 2997]
MVKLRVKCNPREVWGPGQHYFLHFMTVTPFQSHPFTIANLPSAENNELVVLVRQASGVTKRLAKHLGGKDADATIPVFLDGPFGGIHNDLSIYEHVVLIAGGTGITFIMPVLQDLIQKSKNEECVCKSIQVLWSVRDEESISWGITDLEKAVKEAPSSVVTVKIHVTGPSSNPDNESEKEKDPSGGALSYPLYGRADVAGFVSAAASDVRTMGVGACGPETLLYDVRNAVAKIQKDIALGKPGCSELFLHTEEYAW